MLQQLLLFTLKVSLPASEAVNTVVFSVVDLYVSIDVAEEAVSVFVVVVATASVDVKIVDGVKYMVLK